MGEQGRTTTEAGAPAVGDGAQAEVSRRGAGARRMPLRGVGRVAELALGRYGRSPWVALDAALLVTLFTFCFGFGGQLDTTYLFTSAALPLTLLSALTAYMLAHAVVPPGDQLALGRREGAAASVAGLMLATAAVRAAGGVLLVLLALVFGRLNEVSAGLLLAGSLGLALEGALVGAVVVAVATPGAPRYAPLVALGILVLSLVAYDTNGNGVSIWVCRLPLVPFAAAYALGLQDAPALAWLGALVLVTASMAGLVWLAARWLARGRDDAAGAVRADASLPSDAAFRGDA